MTAIPGAIDPAARNNQPLSGGYTYRGKRREGYGDLRALNRRILADRAAAAIGHKAYEVGPTFTWGGAFHRPLTPRDRTRKDTP